MRLETSVLLVSALLPAAQAWGTLGHMTVGVIAQAFLTPQALNWTRSLLSESTATSLSPAPLDSANPFQASQHLALAAPWADTYRATPAGAFSEPFHFIDANDNPPHTCNVDVARDCPVKGCLVSAIANYVRLPYLLSLPLPSVPPPQKKQKETKNTIN